jgi:hypothetical protein
MFIIGKIEPPCFREVVDLKKQIMGVDNENKYVRKSKVSGHCTIT